VKVQLSKVNAVVVVAEGVVEIAAIEEDAVTEAIEEIEEVEVIVVAAVVVDSTSHAKMRTAS
jgi:hypothetical protein